MTDVAIIVVIGIGTYLFRLSFIGLLGARPMPAWAAAPLRYVAPAVLAAIVAPAWGEERKIVSPPTITGMLMLWPH